MAKTIFVIVLMIVVMLYGAIFLLVCPQSDEIFHKITQHGVSFEFSIEKFRFNHKFHHSHIKSQVSFHNIDVSQVKYHNINASSYFVDVKNVFGVMLSPNDTNGNSTKVSGFGRNSFPNYKETESEKKNETDKTGEDDAHGLKDKLSKTMLKIKKENINNNDVIKKINQFRTKREIDTNIYIETGISLPSDHFTIKESNITLENELDEYQSNYDEENDSLKDIESQISRAKFEVRTAYMLACVAIMVIMIFAINNKRKEESNVELPNLHRSFAIQPSHLLAQTLPNGTRLNAVGVAASLRPDALQKIKNNNFISENTNFESSSITTNSA